MFLRIDERPDPLAPNNGGTRPWGAACRARLPPLKNAVPPLAPGQSGFKSGGRRWFGGHKNRSKTKKAARQQAQSPVGGGKRPTARVQSVTTISSLHHARRDAGALPKARTRRRSDKLVTAGFILGAVYRGGRGVVNRVSFRNTFSSKNLVVFYNPAAIFSLAVFITATTSGRVAAFGLTRIYCCR